MSIIRAAAPHTCMLMYVRDAVIPGLRCLSANLSVDLAAPHLHMSSMCETFLDEGAEGRCAVVWDGRLCITKSSHFFPFFFFFLRHFHAHVCTSLIYTGSV